ncbi:hypothetical protein CCACVL1_17744 [Corchorus capsularis]|uniref:Uncharacterized protein n=1 Tax=Corchorus capsularis TaxID=210143 RepID=A0A1R3HQ38_COCAP|nr:hypothetical protein CCACVL1_17744 [Corchorus capsularis]
MAIMQSLWIARFWASKSDISEMFSLNKDWATIIMDFN